MLASVSRSEIFNSQVISLLFIDSNVNKVLEPKMEKYQRLDYIEI